MFKKKFIIFFLLIFILTGCQDKYEGMTGNKDELLKLFPNKKTLLSYSGSGDYYQEVFINDIIRKENKIILDVNGEVKAKNFDELYDDHFFNYKYILDKHGILQQSYNNNLVLDSKYTNLYILKFPLVEGNFWKETTLDSNGNKYKVKSSIESIKTEDGKTIITVYHNEQGSDYYEKRVIKEGLGIVKYSKNTKLDISVGYNFSRILDIDQNWVKLSTKIKTFLTNYNKDWQDFFNLKDKYVFNYYFENSSILEKIKNFERPDYNIEFDKVNIIKILEDNDNIEVYVNEYYIQKKNDEKVKVNTKVKYELLKKDDSFKIINYQIISQSR
ncbi:MAG: hypothetical protein ACQEQE_00965 [Bacillota bacterium]